jgi:hypothetical protein
VAHAAISRVKTKLLAAEAFRRTPLLRGIQDLSVFAAIFLSGFLSRPIADRISPNATPYVAGWVVRIIAALLIYAIFWTLFGCGRLRAAMVRLENA